jgi:hypothetical protein
MKDPNLVISPGIFLSNAAAAFGASVCQPDMPQGDA